MTTPIYDYLKQYKKSGFTWGHMPGHKGRYPYKPLKRISAYDLTEINGADELFLPNGIIEKSEENASKLFKSKFTCFSTEGSTLCIQAMLAMAVKEGGSILAARNAHKSFINGCALLDITPIWIKPDYIDGLGVSGSISPKAVEQGIAENPDASAVYITSPDYLGCISDIAKISEICHMHKKLLLVDNAHGGYLAYLQENLHPISLGADLCCDSAHKTLPALTSAAWLHASPKAPFTKEYAKDCMALFASTSPSYLTMLSLDLCNKYLFERAKEDFVKLKAKTDDIKKVAQKSGFRFYSELKDITKITLDGYSVGYSGSELADFLRSKKIECEYQAQRHIVLLLSPFNSERDFKRIKKALGSIEKRKPIEASNSHYSLPTAKMGIRKAMLAECEQVDIDNAIGRIAAKTAIMCPPGVPIAVSGELIDEKVQKLLKISGILRLSVIK